MPKFDSPLRRPVHAVVPDKRVEIALVSCSGKLDAQLQTVYRPIEDT